MNKDWRKRQSKLDYREHLLSVFQDEFGQRLPDGMQYWSFAGKCNADGKPSVGTEIGQMVEAGFITQRQFFGIDTSDELIAGNLKAYGDANWFCGQFETVFETASHEPWFNPGIVHLDFTRSPKHTIGATVRVLNEIVCMGHPCIVISNMATSSARGFEGQEYQPELIRDLFMQESPRYQRLVQTGAITEHHQGICTYPKAGGHMTALIWEVESG